MAMDVNAFNTVLEMLSDRGYTISSMCDWENLTVYTFAKDNQQLIVIKVIEPKLGINTVKQVKNAMDACDVLHSIVVYNTSITPFAKNSIDDLLNTGYTIELFTVSELQYNVTKHALVPKHTIMPHETKIELLKTFKVAEKKLPLISQKDPVCRYYHAQTGDLIKIDRNPGIYYRIVA